MENTETKLTKKDLRKTFFRYYTFCELGSNYERMQAVPFAASISYCLEKLYKTKKDRLDAMHRQLQFFNTEGTFGSMIMGATVSMEEQKANGMPIPSETITGLKTGLMGPVAGIGDTLIWGTFKTIIGSLAVTLALQGNYLSSLIEMLFPIVTYVIAYNLFFSGYNLGTKSIKDIMKGGLLNQLIDASSAMGLFMMGALSSSYVTFKLITKIKMPHSDPIVLQKVLDDIVPGLLPLLTIFAIYFYLKKKQNYIAVVLAVLVLSLIGAYFGIL
ncbi:PTS system mannose/fructose/sorbose family transporter subunit IID [Lactobacillus sp. ESL0791]|uniref:PTS system mannose/fructose/sorbose family transporter subunit IID n=1 Tax=Lactobacillus sp. ESL0791 TaxID=2983234 RepID=UPI0023F6EC7D|nr:PTS system mannose/fructose/sorbose family transporter subunit IID [Lactobacillus sp. ESL0791]MDF7639646.1 PTS system mannose/fructose/sorbose family transporter subunit IID [Lactobacillus sp. ESL0791]